MEAIDPELRGSDDALSKTELSATAAAATIAHPLTAVQHELVTNGVVDSKTEAPQQTQSDPSPTANGLPYFNETLPDITVPAPTYQPINFTPHEPRKRPRSCESCRGLKVKCEPTSEGSCRRCLKAGRECNYTESSGRRKKKQENKVAELEKQVNGLTAALLAQRGSEASDGMLFDESSLLQNDMREAPGLNGKRRRSELEDGDVNPRAAKHRLLPSDLHSHGIDGHILNKLAAENALKEFCTNMKSMEAWFQDQIKASSTAHTGKEDTPKVNGQRSEGDGTEVEPKASAKATTAPMGRTPLDLLSQVASNENPSASASAKSQEANKWYSPYAKANQDTSGYYSEEKTGDEKSKLDNTTNSIEQVLQAEFGGRATLVMNFLGLFLARSADTNNDDQTKS